MFILSNFWWMQKQTHSIRIPFYVIPCSRAVTLASSQLKIIQTTHTENNIPHMVQWKLMSLFLSYFNVYQDAGAAAQRQLTVIILTDSVDWINTCWRNQLRLDKFSACHVLPIKSFCVLLFSQPNVSCSFTAGSYFQTSQTEKRMSNENKKLRWKSSKRYVGKPKINGL